MITFQRSRTALVVLAASLAGLACNAAQTSGASPTVVATLPTDAPTSVTAAPPLTPTPSPIPIPPGWIAYGGDAPSVSFYYPPDWTTAVIDDYRVEIRPASGFAWMEIAVIDAAHPDPGGMAFAPGADASAFTQALLNALREDGTFDDPTPVPTAAGSGWMIAGHNDRFGDDVAIGVVALTDRAALLIGHRGAESEDWEALKALYQQMIQSVGE